MSCLPCGNGSVDRCRHPKDSDENEQDSQHLEDIRGLLPVEAEVENNGDDES